MRSFSSSIEGLKSRVTVKFSDACPHSDSGDSVYRPKFALRRGGSITKSMLAKMNSMQNLVLHQVDDEERILPLTE